MGFSGTWPGVAGRLALLVSLALAVLPAQAQTTQPLADSQRLIRQGQPAQALVRLDAFLAGNPKDPQGRFLRGVALTELNRPAEAIEAFQQLSEDYPELPEPHNNLAVLYAQQRQYDKARSALEMAIRTHPAYATAHENLGDIYAKLASQAYDKALQLDSANATAQTKLSMIRELISLSVPQSSRAQPPVRPLLGNINQLKGPQLAMGGRQPVLPLPETDAQKARPLQAKPAVVASAAPAVRAPVASPAPQPTLPPQATATSPTTPGSPVVTNTAPAKPTVAAAQSAPAKLATAAVPASVPPTAKLPGEGAPDAPRQVTLALEQWAHAWSSKDFRSYLAAYAPQFKPQGGQSRQAWAAEREARVTKPGSISVTVQDVAVGVEAGNRAVATFRQHYRSSNLNSTTRKTVVFVQNNGRWLIAEERVR